MSEIHNVFVVGSGLMGAGIAQVTAGAGYEVTLHDIDDKRTAMGLKTIKSSLEKFLSKEKISQAQFDETLNRIKLTTEFEDAAQADLCVEAVFEDVGVKQEVFATLDKICPAHAILASNTSAIPISRIAAATTRPERVIGTHFFSPVPVMRLCEIVRGIQTSDETTSAAEAWARSVGKETVCVLKDQAGFIGNRLYLLIVIEAVKMLESGTASPLDIDAAMRLGYNLPMGPLELCDMTGVDILHNASLAIYAESQDLKYMPPPLMQHMVQAGLLGRKSGKGFYDYTSGEQVSYWKL